MTKEEINIKNYVREEATRKIFAKVFDENAVMAIHYLATRGLFDEMEFVISTGKEAHVFRARDSSGNYRAVKVYKIATSDFRHMDKYIFGDERFKKVRKEKRDIVFAWTRKEFKNLEKALAAGVRVPLPIGFKDNVLVMEFVGKDGVAAKLLKEVGFNLEKTYETMVDWAARLYLADLVHADLSEYNILVNGNELVLIDIGQAVLATHPKAREFFERDVRNIAIYLSKKGLNLGYNEVYAAVKKRKEELENST